MKNISLPLRWLRTLCLVGLVLVSLVPSAFAQQVTGYEWLGWSLYPSVMDTYGLGSDASGHIYASDNQYSFVYGPGGRIGHAADWAGSRIYRTYDIYGQSVINYTDFYMPGGVAVDSSGVLYVADTGNACVRQVVSGTITVLAGGPVGYLDGSGTNARFNGLLGIAVDSGSNVYVTDRGNNVIRKITPDGTVSTLAGMAGVSGTADGIGTAAQFNNPFGIAVDSGSNVYVADAGNYTIRKITPDGMVTTFAGLAGSSGDVQGSGTNARFRNPTGLAIDSGGNLYVNDVSNTSSYDGVRKITPLGLLLVWGNRHLLHRDFLRLYPLG